MCGIFAAINGHSVTKSLMAGLEALSYRGYDSAGIAVVGQHGLERRRAEGKLHNLARVLESEPLEATIGIAHTRWATHGAPTESNAHPHMTSRVAVVHNGIIENYQVLREQLEEQGCSFQSETDSEIIPLLITRCLDAGFDYPQAIHKTLTLIEGDYAIAMVFKDQPDKMFAARRGSPLVVGVANGGFYIASDANALSEKSNAICHLDNDDLACISRKNISITNRDGLPVERALQPVTTAEQHVDKQGYPHYMKKEIHEQPETFKQTVAYYLNPAKTQTKLPPLPLVFDQLRRLTIVACGTSYYAGMVGKYWLEGFAHLPVDLNIASEYRYHHIPLGHDEAGLFISQSGETADTLAAMRNTKQAGQICLSLINVLNSSIAHECDGVLPTLAGMEIGVASTKAFTSQLAVLLMLTLTVARANHNMGKKGIDANEERRLLIQLRQLPGVMREFLHDEQGIRRIAAKLQQVNNMLYLGRGIGFPLALEGALKLKETSYIHAEAYPAGELKHGPIALIDNHMPVVIIAPPGPLFYKTLSNLREVSSRGAKVVLISNQTGVAAAQDYIDDAIVMPEVEELFQPILYTLPLQLLAYHIGVLKGTDVDQPRNLAKSVTVE